MGKPAEYLKEMMAMLINRLEGEKGVKILGKEIYEPKELKGNKELFTTFAEIQIEFETIAEMANVIFNYTPSHVEIIKPDEVLVRNEDLNKFFIDLVSKIHQYDEIAKNLGFAVRILEKQLNEAGIAPAIPLRKQEQAPIKDNKEIMQENIDKKKKKQRK